ncbi:MAG: MoxR family ATPase [Nanoarchaeota archaeon]|nr:MoxR family ATPase [Nanoarchaeota archaeon]
MINIHNKKGEKKDKKSLDKHIVESVKKEEIIEKEIEDLNVKKVVEQIEKEMSKVIVGQEEIIRSIMRAVLCNGHLIVEGVPGIAKTLIVRSIAEILGCGMKRIQFTVDLLPTDITGITTYDPKTQDFEVIKGPIFTNFLLADEINRSPPKTQSALLEAMEERTVTILKNTHILPKPFFVMATENPIETSGVYSLPEAQIDRFLFKIIIDYPKFNEEIKILDQNVSLNEFEEYDLKKLLSPEKIIALQKKVKKVYSSSAIKDYIVRITNETRRKDSDYSHYISYGASPRASIAMYIASKAEALMNGRDYVIPSDVKIVAYPILRHRIIFNYEAEAEKISPDSIIKKILERVRVP